MKLIKYQRITRADHGTEEAPLLVETLHTCELSCPDRYFQANYAIAQREAYGEITVEDIPDAETEPSQEEDTAAMLVDHEYRLTLLELGLTE